MSKLSKPSQVRAVLNHMAQYGGITSMEAFSLYGATRLSALIYKLRKDGYNIKTEKCLGKTRFDRPNYYFRYYLEDVEGIK